MVRRPLHRLLLGASFAFIALLVAAGPASAHSQLLASEPAWGAVLDTAPAQVVLRYDDAVDLSGSTAELRSDQPKTPSPGKLTYVGGDHRVVAISLPGLSKG